MNERAATGAKYFPLTHIRWLTGSGWFRLSAVCGSPSGVLAALTGPRSCRGWTYWGWGESSILTSSQLNSCAAGDITARWTGLQQAGLGFPGVAPRCACTPSVMLLGSALAPKLYCSQWFDFNGRLPGCVWPSWKPYCTKELQITTGVAGCRVCVITTGVAGCRVG